MTELYSIWLVILALGVGTYLIRFSFIGLIGSRPLPSWVLRLLRYTPVAVIPGLIAPQVLWPPATMGETDPVRLTAAIVTLIVGLTTRNVTLSVILGFVTLYAGLYLF